MREDYSITGRTIPLAVLSTEELVTAIQTISKERLTTKQKLILKEIERLPEEMTVTKFVVHFAGTLHCSETAVWNNLRQLHAMELVHYGGPNTRGIPLTITPLGKIICNRLEE